MSLHSPPAAVELLIVICGWGQEVPEKSLRRQVLVICSQACMELLFGQCSPTMYALSALHHVSCELLSPNSNILELSNVATAVQAVIRPEVSQTGVYIMGLRYCDWLMY